jgi:hypothetical protein
MVVVLEDKELRQCHLHHCMNLKSHIIISHFSHHQVHVTVLKILAKHILSIMIFCALVKNNL